MIGRNISSLLAASALVLGGGAALAQQGGRPLNVTLSGTAEVPGPGDPDGRGTARVRINLGKQQICYNLSVSNIVPATAAHIHEGSSTEAGPVVVTLTPPTRGSSNGCVAIERELAQRILRSPTNFYVNVHNEPFPKGAVRGQLGK
jgi:hypothetical protein